LSGEQVIANGGLFSFLSRFSTSSLYGYWLLLDGQRQTEPEITIFRAMFSGKQEGVVDIPVLVLFVASMAIVGCLAHWCGRNPWPWVTLASTIGPFAAPVLLLVVAASSFRKTINAPKP
jgi:hypothetical protein